MSGNTKWTRLCGVSSFRLQAEGLIASEVHRANPEAFDAELDRHFREFFAWLNSQPRVPNRTKKPTKPE